MTTSFTQNQYSTLVYPQQNLYYGQIAPQYSQMEMPQARAQAYYGYQNNINQNFQISNDQVPYYTKVQQQLNQPTNFTFMNANMQKPYKKKSFHQQNQKSIPQKYYQGKIQKGFPSNYISGAQQQNNNLLSVPKCANRKSPHKDSFDYSSDASTQIGDNDQYQTQSVSRNGVIEKELSPDEYFEEATVKKPKKHFNSEEERENFVRQYQIKYKTEMCRNWELFGKCKFLDKCSFAHGEHELHKKVHLPSNYKTKSCIQFHTTSYCPYGNRCQFLHSQYDIFNKKPIDYTKILNENIRLSGERANSLKEGNELLTYVNVFPTSRLNVFKNIPQK